jgi:hypothetical protein
MVRLVQTVDLSCTDTNTISKETETRFYMTHITLEFHWVCPKWFLRLRYVWHKPYTYVESRLALYPNGPKRASIWASSPRSTIRCVQIIYEAMVHLPRTVHLSCTETNTVSKRTETSFHLSLVTQEYHLVHPKQFLGLRYVWRKPCTYHAPKLTLSPKGPKGDSTWPTSPWSSIGCVQNDLWGYGTFGANHGSILHRD